jgi:hypothetical protein
LFAPELPVDTARLVPAWHRGKIILSCGNNGRVAVTVHRLMGNPWLGMAGLWQVKVTVFGKPMAAGLKGLCRCQPAWNLCCKLSVE